MKFLTTILLTLLLPFLAFGEVLFTNPVAGKSFVGGAEITVQWKDDGSSPVILETSSFTITVCCGSNAQIIPLATVGTPGNTFSAAAGAQIITIPPGLAGDGPYYFLSMTWTTTLGTVINYSDRFTMTGMVGDFTPGQQEANAAGDTDKPAAVVPQAPPPPAGDSNFAIPYNEQTGSIKYAPMQQRPGTVITAKNAKPQYPTSAYSIYTTKAGPPGVTTTITQPITYPLTTVVNDASPAPMPDDDMARFLNRWKD